VGVIVFSKPGPFRSNAPAIGLFKRHATGLTARRRAGPLGVVSPSSKFFEEAAPGVHWMPLGVVCSLPGIRK